MFYKKPDAGHILCEYGRSSRQALGTRFNLCVWNWHKSKDPGWEKEFLALCKKADLFAAQEAVFSPETVRLLNRSPFHWSGAVSFLSPRNRIPTGIATGCTVRSIQTAYKAEIAEPFFKMPKMTMSSLYPLENGSYLLLLNMHAINFKGNKAFEQNLAHAETLLEQFDGPVIAAGDFNAWSGTRTRLLAQAAKRLGLEEVRFTPDLRTRYLRRPVDFIFTRGLEVTFSRVMETSASDHNPLLAGFRLPAQRVSRL